ncbi:MAG: type I-U CRISPR-associated protein Cas7 [Phycisphaeraceae bacterium]|nr:type I-U CRISPR-associated protein Cas7 [Phycisphaeraceae bacterium]
MADVNIGDLLKAAGPVAIIIKQPLAPVDEDDRVIFPPTYPISKWNGRVHTIRDGDYRVTVELPTGAKDDKDTNRDNQKPGYQIDRFPDGSNICEIDSPQSQSNRIEPKFKTIADGNLVPQVEIQVGSERVNLLDVGHRAGDAIVRMSSLAADIHDAFTEARSRDFFKLATIAPTSLVFGVWDSRSTYVKQQRILKAHIRATNVREVSRSAQYTPAAAYVNVSAIGEEAEKKERGPSGEESNLSQEGMVHALSTQTAGGVLLTEASRLVRTVTINLDAIRALRGTAPADGQDGERQDATRELQEYILGLALVAALSEPDLNLREGCLLKYHDSEAPSAKTVYRTKSSTDLGIGDKEALRFARSATIAFFKRAGVKDGSPIDRKNAVFERGVAEKFLGYSQGDRDKIRKLGPITATTLARFDAQGKDPFKGVTDALKGVKETIGRRPKGKNASPVQHVEAFNSVVQLLESLGSDGTLPEGAADLARELIGIAKQHDDSHSAFKQIEDKIKDYKKARKEGARGGDGAGTEASE